MSVREGKAVKVVAGQYDGCRGTVIRVTGNDVHIRLKGGGAIVTAKAYVKPA